MHSTSRRNQILLRLDRDANLARVLEPPVLGLKVIFGCAGVTCERFAGSPHQNATSHIWVLRLSCRLSARAINVCSIGPVHHVQAAIVSEQVKSLGYFAN